MDVAVESRQLPPTFPQSAEPAAMATDADEKNPQKGGGGGKKQLVACRIEGHKIQKRLSPKKKALDPLRYLPDGGGYYALFTIAAYYESDSEEATTERHHVVQRSYKQFRTLHSRLLKTYPKSNLPRDLPTMRNKRYDNEYIEEKRNELTAYLAQLMHIPEVKASNVLQDFLETSPAEDESSDDEDGLVVPSRMLEGLPGTIVTVRAGQSFSVTLPLSSAGDVASWQFTTKKHNIGFSATFEGEMIRAYSREGADVKPVKGFYRCTSPGTCTLTWDNTYTWSKAKVLIYWAEVESHHGTPQQNGQHQQFATSSDGGASADSEAVLTGSGVGSDDNRRMGFIEHSRSNAMHPRHIVNSSISLLSKPFVHGHGANDDGHSPGKTRMLLPRRTSAPAGTTQNATQTPQRGVPQVKAGSLIIQRSVKFRGRNWYRKWFVLDPHKCVLRYYDSEAAARRGLSLAKLNLTNKHASLAITSSLSLDAAPTPYMFLIRTKKHCWKICAPSQSEYNDWENAITTAILTAQLSRRGRSSKKAMLKAAKTTAVRKDPHGIESDDDTPKSGALTDTNGSAAATMSSSLDPNKPLSPIGESDDDDDEYGNKEDGDSDDDEDDESESDSDDELHEDDDIEVVQPVVDTRPLMDSHIKAVGSLPDLQNLPPEWKFGLAAVLNVALLSVRSAPAVVIMLVLFIMDWYLLLTYMKRTSDRKLDHSSSTKPKAE